MEHAIVVIGGAAPDGRAIVAARAAAPDAFVIAADSGLDHAVAAGLPVALVVGDLDSASERGVAWALDRAIPIERHRPDKDATDTELAIDAAIARGAGHVVVLAGGTAGPDRRLDHLLSAILLLGHPHYAGTALEAWFGSTHVIRLHGPGSVTLPAEPGETLSLLPVGGTADGVSTEGLRYPLHVEPLPAATSRGISNVVDHPTPTIRVAQGTLLVVRPEALPCTDPPP